MTKKELIDNIISNYITSGRINNYVFEYKYRVELNKNKYKMKDLHEIFFNSSDESDIAQNNFKYIK